jgi:hypothetical protein
MMSNSNRSTGAAARSTSGARRQGPASDVDVSPGSCERSEKVEVTGKDCNARGLAVGAVKYRARAGAPFRAYFPGRP